MTTVASHANAPSPENTGTESSTCNDCSAPLDARTYSWQQQGGAGLPDLQLCGQCVRDRAFYAESK